MKIFVTGGTGFVGSRLVPHLVESGHEVLLLARPSEPRNFAPTRVRIIEGDSTKAGAWMDAVAGCDAAVNMAGFPIFGRWTAQAKSLIRSSRVLTTRNLVDAMPAGKPVTLVSTSAVGIYGNAGERELDESSPVADDFLARVARDWESEASRARAKGVRVVIARFAVVFAEGGGALDQLQKQTKWFLGGPIGSGRQWVSWVHREDVVRSILLLLQRTDLEGIFNVCSPKPVRQMELARTLGRVMRRPAFTPAPALVLRLALGQFADVILFSQRMVPRRLLDSGFEFRFPDLEMALRDILAPAAPS